MTLPSEEVIKKIASRTDEITLAFSCGKDSIAAWLAIRPHFKKIVPVYMFLIPELEFVEKSLQYYEDFFETHILRVAHPSLYRMLRHFVFQSPENMGVLCQWDIPVVDYQDVIESVQIDQSLTSDSYHATGVRAADSPIRGMIVRKYGAINEKKKTFWPIWDWRKDRLVTVIKESRVKLPIDYKLFGRSFDGIDFRFLVQIKKYFPDDYGRILDFFPLAEAEIKRRIYGERRWCFK
jgi:hypothetical protein